MTRSTGARRVQVVGLPGSGKSRFARALAGRLGVGCLDLDDVVRLPGGRVVSMDRYRTVCRDFLAAAVHGWVIDGDDVEQEGIRYTDADVVVWLDAPRWRCVARVLRRGVVDLVAGRRAWHGDRESPVLLVGRGATADLARWTWREHGRRTARYAALAAADPRWVRLDARRRSASSLTA